METYHRQQQHSCTRSRCYRRAAMQHRQVHDMSHRESDWIKSM